MAKVEVLKKPVPTKKWKSLSVEIETPNDIKVSYENGVLKVSGAKGELEKIMTYKDVEFEIKDNLVKIFTNRFTQRQKKIIFTYKAHLNNMIIGVTKGFEYKLVVLAAKFPITCEVKNNMFFVKNFLGQKKPRTCKILENVEVKVNGKDIVVSGIDIEKCGTQATLIEQSTRLIGFDRRVIQDGIFITQKPHKAYGGEK